MRSSRMISGTDSPRYQAQKETFLMLGQRTASTTVGLPRPEAEPGKPGNKYYPAASSNQDIVTGRNQLGTGIGR